MADRRAHIHATNAQVLRQRDAYDLQERMARRVRASIAIHQENGNAESRVAVLQACDAYERTYGRLPAGVTRAVIKSL